jgi:hypothetical protein
MTEPFKSEDVVWRWTPPAELYLAQEYVVTKNDTLWARFGDRWCVSAAWRHIVAELLRRLAEAEKKKTELLALLMAVHDEQSHAKGCPQLYDWEADCICFHGQIEQLRAPAGPEDKHGK